MTDAQAKKPELDAIELDKAKEEFVKIDLKTVGNLIKDAYIKPLYTWPHKAFTESTRWTERQTKGMMTGRASLLTMPTGLMVRNAAHCAHDAAEHNRFLASASIAGVAGVGALWWFGGNALYGAMTTGMHMGTLGGIAATGAAAALTMVPAFTAASLGASAAIGAIAFGLSTVPAVINIGPAWERTKHAWKGIKYTDDQIKKMSEDFEKDSLDTRYEAQQYNQARNALRWMAPASREKIYLELKKEFETATAPAAPEAPANTPEPVAAADKPKTPVLG